MQFSEDIQVTHNIRLRAYERGKLVAQREVHNIFLDLGREWISRLIAYQSYGPDVPQRNDRVMYMGFGIGGTKQHALALANANPLGGPGGSYASNSAAGIGANSQVDTDASVTTLERPVRLSGGSAVYPGTGGDAWLGRIQAPAEHPSGTQVRFRRLFLQEELSYGPYTVVPLSEICLFTSLADPGFYLNTGIAYDTFDTLSKTTAVAVEAEWTFNL